MGKVIVISPFQMGGKRYEIGDSIEVSEEQRNRFANGGLIKMDKAPKDKMVKSAPKKKSKRKKK